MTLHHGWGGHSAWRPGLLAGSVVAGLTAKMYSLLLGEEAAQAVVELELGHRVAQARGARGRGRLAQGADALLLRRHHLQVPACRAGRPARRGRRPGPRGRLSSRKPRRSAGTCSPRTMWTPPRCPRRSRLSNRQHLVDQLLVDLGLVAVGVLVEQHQVELQPLEAPGRLCACSSSRASPMSAAERNCISRIGRSPEMPSGHSPSSRPGEIGLLGRLPGRGQVGEDQVPGQALEERHLLRLHLQVAQLQLAVGPGQVELAPAGGVVLVRGRPGRRPPRGTRRPRWRRSCSWTRRRPGST